MCVVLYYVCYPSVPINYLHIGLKLSIYHARVRLVLPSTRFFLWNFYSSFVCFHLQHFSGYCLHIRFRSFYFHNVCQSTKRHECNELKTKITANWSEGSKLTWVCQQQQKLVVPVLLCGESKYLHNRLATQLPDYADLPIEFAIYRASTLAQLAGIYSHFNGIIRYRCLYSMRFAFCASLLAPMSMSSLWAIEHGTKDEKADCWVFCWPPPPSISIFTAESNQQNVNRQ